MGSGKKMIVVIDDEVEILTMLERFFSKTKEYEVKTFNNPLSALKLMPHDTDIVLLDVMMPQINGLDLLPKFFEKYPDTQILIMTAYSTLDKVLNAHRRGADKYIMKPFTSLEALREKVDDMLKKKR
jgi:DNA-binding NtrC family response regulator